MPGAQSLLEGPRPPTSTSKAPQHAEHPGIWQHIAEFAPYTAEFVGSTFMALMWNSDIPGPAKVFKPLVMGLTRMILTYSFASISGSEFNPAVTLSIGVAGKADWRVLSKNSVVQLLGSFSGIALSAAMNGQMTQDFLGPRPPFRNGQVFAVETVYTFMLCFVYLNTLYSRSNNTLKCGNQFFGLAMGFAMMAAGYAGSDVSGGVFNPAFAIAVYCFNFPQEFWILMCYLTAQGLAAFLAGAAFRVVRPNEYRSHEDWLAHKEYESPMGITRLKAFSEGIGTWLFVFTIGMTNLSQSYATARPLAGGAVVVSMNYALGDCSGGYFNPAVTLAVMMSLRKHMSFQQGVCYIIVQMLSAALAAWSYMSIHVGKPFYEILSETTSAYSTPHLVLVAVMFMNITCFAVLATTTVKGIDTPSTQNFYHGLVYGLAYAAGGIATYGPLPCGLELFAIGIGISVEFSHQGSHLTFLRRCFYVVIFELCSAIFAVAVFRLTHWSKYSKQDLETPGEDLEIDGEAKLLRLSDGSAQTWSAYGSAAPSRSRLVGG